MTQLGYRLASRTGDYLTFDATDQSSFSIGPIKVAPLNWLATSMQLANGTATVIGPHATVEKLGQRMA